MKSKFTILNMMQKNTKQTKKGYWVLSLPNTYKCVGNIVKTRKGTYGVTNTMYEFKTFMGALASLMREFARLSGEYKAPVHDFFYGGIRLEVRDYNAANHSYSSYRFMDGNNNVFLFGTAPDDFHNLIWIIRECIANANSHEVLNLRKAELLIMLYL